MQDSQEYDRYKLIKGKLFLQENEVDLSAAMAINILEISFKGSKLTPKIIFPDFFRVLDVNPILEAFRSSETVFTDATVRDDHLSLLELIRQGIKNSYVRIPKLKRTFNVNIYRIITSYLFISTKLKNDCSFYEKLYLTGKLTYYRSVLRHLTDVFHGQQLACSKYVAFHSPFGIESLLVQFFNKLNISTYTLSHGLSYISYKQFIPRDIVNGENILANNVFVLGKSSKENLINNFKINKERIIVGGNPKYPLKEIKPKQSFKKCLVMLGRKIYDDSNFEILNIIDEIRHITGVDFYVKLHPSLNFDQYSVYCNSKRIELIEDKESLVQSLGSDKYDFAIVNNSMAYYESMYYNLICFRYLPSENEEFSGLNDKFSNVSDLLEKMDYFRDINASELASIVHSLLEKTLGMGLSKYKDILNNNKVDAI